MSDRTWSKRWGRMDFLLYLLTHVFIVLTIVKAAYIVMIFMHLGDERKNLQLIILVPVFILVPYLLFIILTEGTHALLMM